MYCIGYIRTGGDIPLLTWYVQWMGYIYIYILENDKSDAIIMLTVTLLHICSSKIWWLYFAFVPAFCSHHYPLVNKHGYGKSPCLIGNKTIDVDLYGFKWGFLK